MRSRLLVFIVGLVAIAGPVAAGCGGSTSSGGSAATAASSGGEPIVIGAPLALTGDYAADGILAKEGIEFAVDELNAKGGVLGRQVKIDYFDIKDMAPDRVVLAAQTLDGHDQVAAVVTGWAGAGGDVQAFGRYPEPYLTCDGSQAVIDTIKKGGYKNAYQMVDGEPADSKDLFEFSASLPYQWPNKTVMTIGSNDAWGQNMTAGFAKAAEAAGWQVVEKEIVDYGTTDWGPIMAKITKLKPALLYFEVPSPPDMLSFLKAFRQNPTNTIINYGYGLSYGNFAQAAGRAADGVIGLTPGMQPPLPASSPEMNAWFKKFTAKYGHPIAGVGPLCYAATMMWAKAVEAVGDPTKYDAVNEYLGTHTFTDVVPGWVPLKFEDGYVHLSSAGSNDGQLQDGKLTTLYNLGQSFTDWQGNKTTFQVPSWIH